MSLKAFHLFFIAVSVMLAVFTAAWAVSQYREVHEAGYVVACVASVLTGLGLAWYGAAFQRKARRL
jgi:hypothetical protein